MPVRIDEKHGYIVGGECDRMHRDRAQRELGGRDAVEWLKEVGALRPAGHGWWRLTKRPTKRERGLDWRAKEAIAGDGAQRKVGCYRVLDQLVPLLRRNGKAFRLAYLLKCVDDVESFELGVSAQTPLGPFRIGLIPPHHDAMYRARKADGDFKQDS